MNEYDAQVIRLRAVCPGAELWTECGSPLVYLPDMKVESANKVHAVDVLLCPRERDSYLTRLFFSARLPADRNWQSFSLMARTWYAISWQGISADQPWLDILGSHLEAVK